MVLALASLLFVLSQFYRVSNAVIAPQLQRELALSAGELGLLSAAFFYAFALTQIPLAFYLDRIGAHLTMTVLSLCAAAGSLLFAAAESMTVAAIGRILLGLGMAGNLMGSMKLVSAWFSPEEFATISGLILALGTLGNMFGATPLALLVDALGWRWSFAAMGCATAFLACLFFCLAADRPQREEASSSIREKTIPASIMLVRLLRSRDYWLISLGAFFRYGVFAAIQGLWAGPYLIKGLGFSPVKAGNVLLLLNTGYLFGGPASGWLSDRVFGSPRRVVLIAAAGMALSLFLLSGGWLQGRFWALGGDFFLLGMFSGFGFMMYAHIKHLMPVEMTGTAVTGINLFTMMGGAVIMQAMGWIVDHWSPGGPAGPGDYEAAFALGFLGMSLIVGPYFFTREHRPEELPEK